MTERNLKLEECKLFGIALDIRATLAMNAFPKSYSPAHCSAKLIRASQGWTTCAFVL